jgi:hypothetical protein
MVRRFHLLNLIASGEGKEAVHLSLLLRRHWAKHPDLIPIGLEPFWFSGPFRKRRVLYPSNYPPKETILPVVYLLGREWGGLRSGEWPGLRGVRAGRAGQE